MILLGLGANLDSVYGSPCDTLHRCCSLFSEYDISVVRGSSVWKSAPVPMSDQPWYCNAVCEIETTYEPYALLDILNQIERDLGRVRGVRNQSRTLDLDILSYHDVLLNTDHLTVPHPRMHERAFILCPLQEIAPEWWHPSRDQNVAEMIAHMPAGQEIERIENSILPCVGDA